MRFFIDAMTPRMDWELPWTYKSFLAIFIACSMALRGIWAAALTPVEVWKATESEVQIPSWDNMEHVKEYPSQVGKEGPTIQNTKGRFSYSVGMQLLGSLLASATSATPIDGKPREHRKMDNSRYTYIGRSYGIGAAAGLVDGNIQDDELAIAYSYQEDGYDTAVTCIYNETADFRISEENTQWAYAAQGELPDSDAGPEYSSYIGHDGNNIVALGVGHFRSFGIGKMPPRRFIGFATGKNYDFLNTTQCELDFVPARFNVSVNVAGRNITVTPTDEKAEDINPSRHLRSTVIRQFELIANDETNLYVSMVGSAFNNSITDMRTYLDTHEKDNKRNESEIVLGAVANSIKVMTDDMLGAYAAAQLVVGEHRQDVPATVRIAAIAIGETSFSIAVFVINTIILLAFLVEVVRTRWWRGMPLFDVADPRQLAVAASEGGTNLGKLASGRKRAGVDIGNLLIRYEGDSGGRYALGAGQMEEEKTPIAMESMDFSKIGRERWESTEYGGNNFI